MTAPLAIMPAYNEADIIFWTVSHLLNQGFRVHVIDNWSTDYTGEIAEKTGAEVSRWPLSQPIERVEWAGILRRVEEIASVEDGWVMFNDADEIRYMPEIFYHVANAVTANAWGFRCYTYWPTDDGYNGSQNPEQYFQGYLPATVDTKLPHIKLWLQVRGKRVDLHSSGGHEAKFEGRIVAPTFGILKHYPVRSSSHARRKIFQERNPRWSPEEKARRWHTQYSSIRPNDPIIKSPAELIYDPPDSY